MSFEPLSANHAPFFAGIEPEGFGQPPCPAPVKSARSRNRAAWWRQDLDRTAVYLMGQARTEDERAFVEQLYDEALKEGPDFINYRAKSAFEAAPRLGIDRNAYARILNALDMIERGTYRHCRDKGKQGIPRTVARVLKCLLNLALRFGEVRPSLDGIARLACVCKQTVPWVLGSCKRSCPAPP
jgi:RNA polymerase-binding transcription factor DksA